jgi:hypothetical protein
LLNTSSEGISARQARSSTRSVGTESDLAGSSAESLARAPGGSLGDRAGGDAGQCS